VVEAVIAAAGLARYADDSDALFGVPPWLPALYFAFGVVVATLAEIASSRHATRAHSGRAGGGNSLDVNDLA
jgi:hypothetical protein